MADFINIYRGGTPDVKCLFCNGQFAEFHPPFSAPSYPDVPPYNSHAEGSYGQGYLNLYFPLVPHLADTAAHLWMSHALRRVKAVGDTIMTNWIPFRSFVTDLHWEVTKFDDKLTGVYLKPVAYRAVYDFDTETWEYKANDDYASMLSNAGVDQFPLGTPADGDALYAFAHNDNLGCTFGHNIPKIETVDDKPKATGGFDDKFGAVVLGYEVTAGEEDQLKLLPFSSFALYFSAKLMAFDCAAQI